MAVRVASESIEFEPHTRGSELLRLALCVNRPRLGDLVLSDALGPFRVELLRARLRRTLLGTIVTVSFAAGVADPRARLPMAAATRSSR